jgi:hypothetical protein
MCHCNLTIHATGFLLFILLSWQRWRAWPEAVPVDQAV